MRGFVDYRVRVLNRSSSGNTTIEWSLTNNEVEEVRLQKDGETIVERDGSHTPALDYQIEDDWSANLTFEAEIHVRLKKTTRIDRGDETDVEVTYRTGSPNVSDLSWRCLDHNSLGLEPSLPGRVWRADWAW